MTGGTPMTKRKPPNPQHTAIPADLRVATLLHPNLGQPPAAELGQRIRRKAQGLGDVVQVLHQPSTAPVRSRRLNMVTFGKIGEKMEDT